MVMDIRQTWADDGDGKSKPQKASASEPAKVEPAKVEPAKAEPAEAAIPAKAASGSIPESAVPSSPESGHVPADQDQPMDILAEEVEAEPPTPSVDLEDLITQLATGDAQTRARAANELRALVPGAHGIDLLFEFAAQVEDVRRLPAIQALGHHRQWLSSRKRVESILRLARDERDQEMAASLVWTLRQREELREFLLHPMHTVAREAALGVPVSEGTVEAIVHAMLVGRAPDVDTILSQKLSAMHTSLTRMAIDVLQVMASFSSADEQRLVLENLPQAPLFEAFVEGRSRPALNPEPTEGETRALKQWHDLSRLTSQALLDRPGPELIRYLVNRCASDEPFARRHAGFLERAMAGTRAALGSEVLDDFERLTQGATEERLERMAKLLMELVDKIAGGESHSQAADLLERWKSHSPTLKLKIFHMQQGLA